MYVCAYVCVLLLLYDNICGYVFQNTERARQAKLVGASMECRVFLHTSDAALKDALKTIQGDSSILPQ